MKESNAKLKICPMMSNHQSRQLCRGNECAVWGSYEYEEHIGAKSSIPEGFYQPAKVRDNKDGYAYRMVNVGLGECGLIAKGGK